jgi:hypothetical protein
VKANLSGGAEVQVTKATPLESRQERQWQWVKVSRGGMRRNRTDPQRHWPLIGLSSRIIVSGVAERIQSKPPPPRKQAVGRRKAGVADTAATRS